MLNKFKNVAIKKVLNLLVQTYHLVNKKYTIALCNNKIY